MTSSLCAFCSEPTDLLRACLTPQCQTCATDRIKQPDLACLPECTFPHQSTQSDSLTSEVSLTRQVSLLQVLAEVFLQRVEVIHQRVDEQLEQVSSNLKLAELYQRLGLDVTAAVKGQILLREQLQFHSHRCDQAKANLVNTILTPLQLSQLYHQLDLIDRFLAGYDDNHLFKTITPLVLSHQVIPRTITLLDSVTIVPYLNQDCDETPQANHYERVLAPGCSDDIILLQNYHDYNQPRSKLYYNLTKLENVAVAEPGPIETNVKDRPTWLPQYYNDFSADDYFGFSDIGVWLFNKSEQSLRHQTLIGSAEITQPIRTSRYIRLTSLASQGKLAIVTDSQDLLNGLELSAWQLIRSTDQAQWVELWRRPFPADFYGFYAISLASTGTGVITATRDRRQASITITVLDFTTAQIISQVNFIHSELKGHPGGGALEHFCLFEDCLYLIATQYSRYTNCYVYSLLGQLLSQQSDFIDQVERGNLNELALVRTHNGQLTILY